MVVLPFTSRIESHNGVARIGLSGELDIATAPILEYHLTNLEGDGVGAIMLDLRDLTFLDCSALTVFLAARNRAKANGHQLILVGAGARARRLFQITSTEFLLDEQEAVALLEQFTGREIRRTAQTNGQVVDANA